MSVLLQLLFILLTFFRVSTMRPEIQAESFKESETRGTGKETETPFCSCLIQGVFGRN